MTNNRVIMEITDDDLKHPNVRKFLELLAKAEGAEYNTITGSKYVMKGYEKHPAFVGAKTKDGISTAAGRYQITKTTYDRVAKILGLSDFTPQTQDKIAIYLMKEKGVLDDIKNANYQVAINGLGGTWASLPSSPYKQHKRSQEWMNQAMAELKMNAQAAAPAKSESNIPIQNLIEAYNAAKKDNNTKVVDQFSRVIRGRFLESYNAAANAGNVKAADQLAKKFREFRSGEMDRDSALNDTMWVNNAKILYKGSEGKPFYGSDKEAAEWLKNYMSGFNNNMVLMASRAKDLQKMSPAAKAAFVTSLDDFDEMPFFSMEGALQGAKFQAMDPTNLASVGSLGFAGIGTKAMKEALKLQVKGMLRGATASTAGNAAMKTAAVAGADSAIVGGAQDYLNQEARVNAGTQQDIDAGKVAGAAGTAGAMGAVIGGPVAGAVRWMANKTVPGRMGSLFDGNPRAREDAEIITDAAKLRAGKNEAVPSTIRGNIPLSAQDMTNMAKGYRDLLRVELGRAGFNDEYIDAVSKNPSMLYSLPDSYRQRIEQAMGGPEAIAQLSKANRVGELTPAISATQGVPALGRAAIDAGIDATLSASTGIPLPISTPAREAAKRFLGGRKYRWQNAEKMVDPTNVKAAEAFTAEAGPSDAAQGMLRIQQAGDAKQAADAQTSLLREAEKQRKAAEAAAKQQNREAEKAAKAAEVKARADAKAAEEAAKAAKAPQIAIAEQMSRDPTYILGLSDPLGQPRNQQMMDEMWKTYYGPLEKASKAETKAADKAAKQKAIEEANKKAQEFAQRILDGDFTAIDMRAAPFQKALEFARARVKEVGLPEPSAEQYRDALIKGMRANPEHSVGVGALFTPGARVPKENFYGAQNRALDVLGVPVERPTTATPNFGGAPSSGVLTGATNFGTQASRRVQSLSDDEVTQYVARMAAGNGEALRSPRAYLTQRIANNLELLSKGQQVAPDDINLLKALGIGAGAVGAAGAANAATNDASYNQVLGGAQVNGQMQPGALSLGGEKVLPPVIVTPSGQYTPEEEAQWKAEVMRELMNRGALSQ